MDEHEPDALDTVLCYRATCTRATRFDGRFFVGVRTTSLYCRPVCPARTPQRENVTFYRRAAAAEAAGSRPCLAVPPRGGLSRHPGVARYLGNGPPRTVPAYP